MPEKDKNDKRQKPEIDDTDITLPGLHEAIQSLSDEEVGALANEFLKGIRLVELDATMEQDILKALLNIRILAADPESPKTQTINLDTVDVWLGIDSIDGNSGVSLRATPKGIDTSIYYDVTGLPVKLIDESGAEVKPVLENGAIYFDNLSPGKTYTFIKEK